MNNVGYNMQVAKTIKGQINQHKLWSYGAHKYMCINENGLYGLQFLVQKTTKLLDQRAKPIVKIILNGMDLYNVSLTQRSKKQWFTETKKDIYWDQLNVILDDLLETKDWLKTCPDSQYYIKKESI